MPAAQPESPARPSATTLPVTPAAPPPAALPTLPVSAPLTALAVTLGVQMIASVGQTSPSVLAPVMAGEIGVGAQHVGWLVSLAYLAAMLSGLSGGWLNTRFGSVRASQGALLASAGGMALMAAGHPLPLLLGAVLLGIGYGITNPTAADILSRHAPAHQRGLFFSIKQTGVPIGVALTGLLMPALLVPMNWSQAVLTVSAAMAIIAIAIGPTARALEVHRGAASHAQVSASSEQGAASSGQPTAPAPAAGRSPPSGQGILGTLRTRLVDPLREVMAFAPTRRLGITSCVYAFTQISFLTFLVSLLKLEHHYTLALAASLLAVSQAASVVARIGWGHVADRWVDPTRLLGLLGVAMAASVALIGLAPVGTPMPVMLGLTVLCAVTAVSWNGVFFADLVRHVPSERVAQTTGATQFLTFMGGMGGSAAFAALVSLTGSYATVYAVIALLPGMTGLVLLVSARQPDSLGK